MITIELLDDRGRVYTRSQHQAFPIRIGRGYEHNHVIIDDPYVSPDHLAIESNGNGEIIVRDLESENGLYLLPIRKRVPQTHVASEALLRIGHSTLRIRTPNFIIPPTKKDSNTSGKFLHTLNHRGILVCLIIFTITWLITETYWSNFSKTTVNELALIPMWGVFIVSLWSGFWGIMSKISVHRTYFNVHVIIACLATISSSLFEIVYEFYSFSFSATWSSDIIFWGGASLLLYIVLLAHLRLCTNMDVQILAWRTGVVTACFIGLIGFSWHITTAQLSSSMTYHGVLKPPAFQVSQSLTFEEFFGRAKELKNELMADRPELPKTEFK